MSENESMIPRAVLFAARLWLAAALLLKGCP